MAGPRSPAPRWPCAAWLRGAVTSRALVSRRKRGMGSAYTGRSQAEHICRRSWRCASVYAGVSYRSTGVRPKGNVFSMFVWKTVEPLTLLSSHTHTNLYTHIFIRTRPHTYAHTHTYLYTHIFIHTHPHTHMHTHVFIHTHSHKHSHTHIRTHA